MKSVKVLKCACSPPGQASMLVMISSYRSFTGTVGVFSRSDWDEPNGHGCLLEHLRYAQ